MLNQIQSREYNRCQKLHTFFNAHGAIINTYVPFEEEVTSFVTHFTLFQNNIPEKGSSGTCITTAQKELRGKIALAAAGICDMACAYASKYNDAKLAAQVCYTKSDIQRLKDGDILGTVIRISNALSPLMQDANFMKYQVTGDMLGDVLADATVFNNNIGKASLEENDSSIANKNINEAIILLRENIKQFDRLIYKFNAGHADFVNSYSIAAALDNTGIHHSGVEGTIKNAATGEPIKEVMIATSTGNKKTISDTEGYYELLKLRAGEYDVVYSAEGFTSKTVTVRIARGKVIKADVTL